MFGPIRAVAIDDEPAHLLSITTGLSAIGIPCMGYWFDRATSELRPKPQEGGLPFLRVVFSDLNMAELGGVPDTPSLWAGVINVLKQLVAKDSGPYLLVFWTQVGSKVADVAKMLYDRAEQLDGIPCPIAVVELPKGQFIVTQPTGKDFYEGLQEFYIELHRNIAQLEATVRTVVATDAQLNAVSAWESRAADAAALAVNEVYRCARADESDPRRATEAFKKVLAKVAMAASGAPLANAAPARALDAGMLDILVDQFSVSVDDPTYQSFVSNAISKVLKDEDIHCTDDGKVSAALNTFFHVDSQVASTTAAERGVVISAKSFNKGELGFTLNDQLNDFLIPWELFPSDRQLEVKSIWNEVRRQAEFVLVELGADCDHAQDTPRTRRFLLGLEVPTRFSELLKFSDTGKLRNGALQLLGPWTLDGASRWLLVSCKRFWVWQKKEPHEKSVVRYRLRTPVVNKLLHHYASWHSRPGIVEFSTDLQPGTALYFAYGSNMLSLRLKLTAPSATKLDVGILMGHQLIFDKVGTDGSGKCDIQASGNLNDEVFGALFLLDTHELALLDAQENGYLRYDIKVTTSAGECAAFTYKAETIDPKLLPFDWYIDLVAAGGDEHKLPAAYLDKIRAMAHQVDADAERSAKNRIELA